MSGSDEQELVVNLVRLRQELGEADTHLDRLGARLAASQGEVSRLRMEAGEAAAHEAMMGESLSGLREVLAARDTTIAGMTQDLRLKEREIMDLRLQISTLHSRAKLSDGAGEGVSFATQAGGRSARGADRSGGRTRRSGDEDRLQEAVVEILKDIAGTMAGRNKWWEAVLPGFWLRRIAHARLRRRGVFDAKLYRKRYPDVARTGIDPVRHYVLYGLEEGRQRN